MAMAAATSSAAASAAARIHGIGIKRNHQQA